MKTPRHERATVVDMGGIGRILAVYGRVSLHVGRQIMPDVREG